MSLKVNVSNMSDAALKSAFTSANRQAHNLNAKGLSTQAKFFINLASQYAAELAKRSGKNVARVEKIDKVIKPITNVFHKIGNAATDAAKSVTASIGFTGVAMAGFLIVVYVMAKKHA